MLMEAKSKIVMAINSWEQELAQYVWPEQDSFFIINDASEIDSVSQPAAASPTPLAAAPQTLSSGYENWTMDDLWSGLENSFNNDPDFSDKQVMNKEAALELSPIKATDRKVCDTAKNDVDVVDLYLNSTTLIDPVSAATSPKPDYETVITTALLDDNQSFKEVDVMDADIADKDVLDPILASFDDPESLEALNSTSAMQILNDILASCGSSMPSTEEAQDAVEYLIQNTAPFDQQEQITLMSLTEDLAILKSIGEEPSTSIDAPEIAPAAIELPKRTRNKRKICDVSDNDSVISDDSLWEPETKRTRKPRRNVIPVEEKKLRKKSQNKTAANRYRLKKRAEQEVVEANEAVLKKTNDELREAVEKLRMEFKILYPLAFTAFGAIPSRRQKLELQQQKVNQLLNI